VEVHHAQDVELAGVAETVDDAQELGRVEAELALLNLSLRASIPLPPGE
jgi:hypothetical protein